MKKNKKTLLTIITASVTLIIGVIFLLITIYNKCYDFSPTYTEVSMNKGEEIVKILKENKIDYRISPDGTIISLRKMDMARAGAYLQKAEVIKSQHDIELDFVDAYLTIIKELFIQGKELLNANLKYLAIDTTGLAYLDTSSKNELLTALENYQYTVLDTTLKELEKNGLIEDFSFKDGILLKIEVTSLIDNTMELNASIWHSGKAAVHTKNARLEFKNGKWELVAPNGWNVS